MRRITLTTIAILAVLALGSLQLGAQEAPTKIVFVDAQAAINLHPSGQEAEQLQQMAREEISELRTQIDTLAQKARGGQQLTPEEAERYSALITTLEAVQQRYQADIAEAVGPAIEAVNEIIRGIAQENGYTIVMDITQAANGLVVYAQEGLDITEQVLARVEAQFGGDGG